jgi:hypothetical protein
MQLYTKELDDYVQPKLKQILLSDNYMMYGNYGKTKYITDIDISNTVDKYIHPSELKEIIKKIDYYDFFFTYCTVSLKIDKYFNFTLLNDEVKNYSLSDALESLDKLVKDKILTNDEKTHLAEFLPTSGELMPIVVFLNELFKHDKKRFDIYDIDSNDFIYNDSIVIHYVIIYKESIIPIDLSLTFKDRQIVREKKFEFIYLIPYAYKEYYYILRHFAKIKEYKDEINEFIKTFEFMRMLHMQIFNIKNIKKHRPDKIIMIKLHEDKIKEVALKLSIRDNLDDIHDDIEKHINKYSFIYLKENLHKFKFKPKYFYYVKKESYK